MPIKDPKERKAYQREWARRKRAGQKTSGIDPKKAKSYKPIIKTNGDKNEYNRKNTALRKHLKDKYLGSKCVLCGTDKGKIDTHRKDGKEHQPLSIVAIKKFENEISSGEFVRLCTPCHNTVHRKMRELDLWKLVNNEQKILTMNDINQWLIKYPDNVITQRMLKENNGRSTWKDQYSKFADFLSIVNSITQ